MTTAKNEAYWQKRFEQMSESLLEDAMDYYDDVERMYREAMNRIEKDIARWYMRLADNNNISYADARKFLTKSQLKDFKMTLDEYIRKGKENGVTADWTKELENASVKYHISRLEAIQLQIQQHLETLFGNQLDGIDEMMRETYRNGYYQTAYELQKAIGVGFDVQQIDETQLEKIMDKPWAADGSNFSDRIWNDKKKLLNTMQNELIQGLVRGDSQREISQRLAKRMHTSMTNAGRLIATESAYFGSLSEKDSMKELGVEKYEILATLDSRTSDICREMDGKTFAMAEFKPGVTAPPFHPWCRSCTVPYIEGWNGKRAARGEDGKTYHVPGNMTYSDWKKVFVDKTISFDLYKRSTPESVIIKEKALAGEIKLTVNKNKQARHDKSSTLYQEGKSYMTISMDEIQEIVNKYAGTGNTWYTGSGEWVKKEVIILPKEIGVNVDREIGEENPTCRLTIHYSKTGVHVVPAKNRKESDD